jgi:excisionase family DNA binding protein
MTKEFYTVEEIAELLRIRPGTVRNRLSKRDRDMPPSIVIGRRRLFPLSAYDLWIKQRICERLPDRNS